MDRTGRTRIPPCRLGRVCGAIALVCALLLLWGCNVVGAVAHRVTGPPKIEPQYVPAHEPMLVIAENYANPSDVLLDAEQLVRYVSQDLEKNNVAPIIEPVRALDLRALQPGAYRQMTIADIGRTLGARQVLYIDVLHSGIVMAEASDMMRARMAARVRLVDVGTGQTLWPTDAAEGHPLAYETPLVRRTRQLTEDTLRQQAARGLALRIARLFYTYRSETPGPT